MRASRKTALRLVERSAIVVLAADGVENKDIAQRLAEAADDPDASFVAGLIVSAHAPSEKALLAKAAKAYDRFVDVEPFW